MRVTSLELRSFRSYDVWALEPDPFVTILVGPNATGKTNIIEGLQLVTACTSFRNPRWDEVVKWGSEAARVSMSAEGESRHVEIVLDVTDDGRRAYRVNGTQKRRVSDVAGTVPSVSFTPDDLGMVKGSADVRRGVVDEAGEQLSSAYSTLRRDYERVVRQRNRLLKDSADRPTLEPWDEQLVSLGARLTTHRSGLVARLAAATSEIHTLLAGGTPLGVSYVSGIADDGLDQAGTEDREAVEAAMRRRLEARAADERARMMTLVGPHRDDIAFSCGGRNARSFASQGQQRTIALAWKLAELRVVEEVTGTKPILLLDDVMSELDESRRRALVDVVRDDIQTFITTTNIGYFDANLVERSRVVEVGR